MKSGLFFSTNETLSLDKWNSYYSELYLPNMILLTIKFIIETCGNATVICVYQRGLKNMHPSRLFYTYLDNYKFNVCFSKCTFQHVATYKACNIPWFLGLQTFFLVRVILGLSLMIMTTIAVSRFQQICHIFKCPTKTSHLWTFVICYSIVSAISYIPTFFFYFSELSCFRHCRGLQRKHYRVQVYED